MAELLWKKPPWRTSTCGRHRFRRNHPLCEPRMWQGQVWEARPEWGVNAWQGPSLERGMEAASGKKRTPQHEGVTEGRGGNGRKTPPPPHTMCHTPHWASAGRIGRVAFYYFVFLKRRKCIRGHFLVVFGIRSGPSHRFLPHPQRQSAGIRACIGRYVNQNGWFSGPLPCDVAAQVDRNRKGL